MNSLLIIGVAAGAIYLLSKKSDEIAQVKKEVEDIKKEQDYQAAVEKQKKYDEDLTNKCKPVDFTALIGDYRASEIWTDVRYFVRMKNDADIPLTITFNNIALSFMATSQKEKFNEFYTRSFTIQPHTETDWELVVATGQYMFHANTFGKTLFAKYGYDSVWRFRPATVTIQYAVSSNLATLKTSKERTIDLNTEVFFVDFTSTPITADPMLTGAKYPNTTTLREKIKHYRDAGRPDKNWYGGTLEEALTTDVR